MKDSAPAASVPLSRYAIFSAIAVSGCTTDLLTKEWIFRWRGEPRPDNVWWILEPYFGIETALNDGALFGMGQGFSTLFAGLSLLAAVGILVWMYLGAAQDRLLTVALGLIMGGVLGNLYDRLGWWTAPWAPTESITKVRDWILFRYGQYTWPNFNVADMLLVLGAGLLVYHACCAPLPTSDKADTAETD